MFCEVVFSLTHHTNKAMLLLNCIRPYIFDDNSWEKQALFMDEHVCDCEVPVLLVYIVQKKNCVRTGSMCYQFTSQERWERTVLERKVMGFSVSSSTYWCFEAFSASIKQLSNLGGVGGIDWGKPWKYLVTVVELKDYHVIERSWTSLDLPFHFRANFENLRWSYQSQAW